MNIQEFDLKDGIQLITAHKPYGIATHAVDQYKPGFIEWLESRLQQKLFLFQRLDKETSGLLLMARSAASAEKLTQLWNSAEVKKNYLVLVESKAELPDHFSVESFIDKKEGKYFSHKNLPANSATSFTVLQRFHSGVTLLQASLHSGKTHQIRLHLAGLGLPVLGDTLYAGAPFHRLALHAHSVEIPSLNFSASQPAPDYFLHFDDYQNNSLLMSFESALHRRRGLQKEFLNCQRLMHTENQHIRIDVFNKTLWIYDYGQEPLSEEMVEMLFQQAQKTLPYLHGVLHRHMLNRGQQNAAQETETLRAYHQTEKHWLTYENHLAFEIRSDSGLSPGLFLDQRQNRLWVKSHSQDKSVLNLFAFTAGFSVAAASGGAREVCTVDVSRRYIDWSKRNFEHNQLNPKLYEFWTTDSLLFLKGAIKKGRKFDLIICDPPSLGRSKEGVFKFEKDWKQLLAQCAQLLSSQGQILFSHNLEKWDNSEWRDLLLAEAQKHRLKWVPGEFPDLDFEADINNTILKATLLQKH